MAFKWLKNRYVDTRLRTMLSPRFRFSHNDFRWLCDLRRELRDLSEDVEKRGKMTPKLKEKVDKLDSSISSSINWSRKEF